MRMSVIPKTHASRRAVERFIADLYAYHYGAEIVHFPPALLALQDRHGAIKCASGLRFAEDGFFSEYYLDEPIEAALTRYAQAPIARHAIFEVTSLASAAPSAAMQFLRGVVAYGELAGFSWAFFTATGRLRLLLSKLDLPIITLGRAQRTRVLNPDAWGTYYETDPCVCAVDRAMAGAFLAQFAGEQVHA